MCWLIVQLLLSAYEYLDKEQIWISVYRWAMPSEQVWYTINTVEQEEGVDKSNPFNIKIMLYTYLSIVMLRLCI